MKSNNRTELSKIEKKFAEHFLEGQFPLKIFRNYLLKKKVGETAQELNEDPDFVKAIYIYLDMIIKEYNIKLD